MYLSKVTITPSAIEGNGVFAMEPITKNTVVWKYNPQHDKSISEEQFSILSEKEREEIKKIGYLSMLSKTWIFPPEGDPACFTNHNASINNLSVVYEPLTSPEPFFRANRDIAAGEELTVNYLEFDEFTIKNVPNWI